MRRRYQGHGSVPSQGMRAAFSGSDTCDWKARDTGSLPNSFPAADMQKRTYAGVLSHFAIRSRERSAHHCRRHSRTGLGACDQNGVAFRSTSPLTSSGVCDATQTER